MPLTPPLDQKFPGLYEKAARSLPTVAAILFGFSTSFFSQVSTADQNNMGCHLIGRTVIPVKHSILLISFFSCCAFIFSVYSFLFAEIFDVSNVKVQYENDLGMKRFFEQRRRTQIIRGIRGFNLGICLLPLAAFMLLGTELMLFATVVYLLSIIYFVVYLKHNF